VRAVKDDRATYKSDESNVSESNIRDYISIEVKGVRQSKMMRTLHMEVMKSKA
jgi:hypothetical protein